MHGASFPRHYHFFFVRSQEENTESAQGRKRRFSALEEVTDREFCDIVKQNLSEKVKYKMISEKFLN